MQKKAFSLLCLFMTVKCLYTIHQETELSQELITILHFLCQNPPRTDNPHKQPKMVNKPFVNFDCLQEQMCAWTFLLCIATLK